MTLTSAPLVRTVDALPAPPISEDQARNWWPSYCEACGTDVVWFPTLGERRAFEDAHRHGGAD
jgi:hypothetical protein